MIRHLIAFLGCLFIFSCGTIFDNKDVKVVYFPNSDRIKQSIEYKNGKKNGVLKEFYGNGNPKTIQHYRNDTLIDSSLSYFDNGVLSRLQVFKDTRRSGCWKKFNKDGREYWNANFKNGELDGKAEEYSYRTIRLLTRGNYKNGRKDGRQECYYPNGKLKYVTYFDDGSPRFGAQEWDESGKPINNDFNIHVAEKNTVLMENKLSYYITLDNPQPDDQVYEILGRDTGFKVTTIQRLIRKNNTYVMDFHIARGGFVMEEVHIGAYRKTAFGNHVFKRTKFMASANNF